MKRLTSTSTLVATFALLTALAPIAGADVSVIENNKTLAVDCAKDKSVNIVGNRITITLTGTCERVNVSGNHATVTGSAQMASIAGNNNTLSFEGVDELSIAGNKNTITWKRGATAGAPKVSNVGKNNTVTRQ